MKIHCTSCGTAIPAADIHLETTLAKCRQCDTVFSFAQAAGVRQAPPPEASRQRGAIPTPPDVKIEEGVQDLRLTQRWFSLKYIPMAFFCIAWDSFLIFWYAIALTQGGPWIMAVFPIAHVAVGIGLTYYTIAGFINRTRILVSRRIVAIAHGPLPWTGKVRLDAHDIAQLYCQEEANRNKNGTYYRYQLSALLRDGRKIKLLSNLNKPDTALFIEQRIEKWLKIEDHPVEGEMAR
jgi:hypothetical protein